MSRLCFVLAAVAAFAVVVEAADSTHERVASASTNSTFSDSLALGSRVPGSPTASPNTIPYGMADQIVVYSATWCMPCRRLHPVLMSLKQEGYQVTYRDVDGEADSLEYKYDAVPTIYFVRNKIVIKTETGYRSKSHIKEKLMLHSRRNPHIPAD